MLFQPNILSVFTEMQKPTVKRSTLALVMVVLTVYISYLLIGILGYLPFAASNALKQEILTAQNIFTAGVIASWAPNQVYRVLFLATAITMILAGLFPVKLIFLEMFGQSERLKKCPKIQHFLAALILCIILVGVSLPISSTSLAIRAIGVTCYPALCFVLPALFYICKPKGGSSCRSRAILFTSWIILVIMIVFIVHGIYDLITTGES